ncbi:hypothetical protein [Paenibacillus terrae]|uniref:Uncharacterized protein n=1 Tax=Paenibacillus terrae TaxID=159743 RepID=A0A0D7X6N0_9BACL|nr:hypothetical protein [Paenibacillus terrae]KJD47036.1 hypothetical protein QD47_02430 [Paenibacillus terrae]
MSDLQSILSSRMDAQVYAKVSRIAPTIALQAGSGMYDAMPKLADLFDKKTESEKVLAEIDEPSLRDYRFVQI